MDLGAPQFLGAHRLPGCGLHKRRTAEKNGALVTHDDSLVRHRRDIGAARRTRSHHGGNLGDPGGGEIGLIIEDTAEMIAIGKHLGLARQIGAPGIDQIDAWQSILECDLLRAKVLFNRKRKISAALDGGIIGNDDAFPPLDSTYTANQSGAVDCVLIHAVRRQRRQLKKRRAGIDEPQHPLAGQQLAPRGVALACPGGSAQRRFGATAVQILHQRMHLRRIGAEFKALGIDRRIQNRHGPSDSWKPTTGQSSILGGGYRIARSKPGNDSRVDVYLIENALSHRGRAPQLTANGANASMSVTTSITAGRWAASAWPSAAGNALAFSTLMPSAPMSSAMRAKFILLKVHKERPPSVWVPP